MAIIDKIQLSGTVYTIGNETTTAVTSASTDNEIPTAKAVYDAIPQGGGGKAVSGGTNISITTGETADTINCTLPYYKLSGEENYSIYGQTSTSFKNQAKYAYQSLFIGFSNEVKGNSSSMSYGSNYVIGTNNKINGKISYYSQGYNVVIGDHNSLSGTNLSYSYVIGKNNSGYTSNTLLTGWYNQAHNAYESSFGKYNASNTGSTDADKSLFSVGNGTSSARHNAFEIRQNGDIYLTKDGQDVKLQDQLGGGGSSYTAGDGIDITNDVISVTGKQDTLISGTNIKTINNESLLGSGNIDIQGGGGGITSGEVQTMIDESISGKTNQNDNLFTIRTNVIDSVVIAGGAKLRIIFAFDIIQNNQIVLSTDTVNDKSSLLSALATLGFDNKIYDIRGINYTDDTSLTSYFGEFLGHKCYAVLLGYVPDFGSITIGLKRNNAYYTLDSVGNGKYNYNYLNNKPSVTSAITSGSTDIVTSGGVYDQLGGLKLVKLTQSEYDGLTTKDSNTLYIING